MSDVACCYTFRSSLFGGFFASQPGKSFFGIFYVFASKNEILTESVLSCKFFLVSTKLSHGRRDGGGGQQLRPRPDAAKRFLKKIESYRSSFFITSREKILLSLCLERRKEKKVTNGFECFFKKYWKITSVQILFDVFFSKVQFLKNGWTGSTFALLMPKGD